MKIEVVMFIVSAGFVMLGIFNCLYSSANKSANSVDSENNRTNSYTKVALLTKTEAKFYTALHKHIMLNHRDRLNVSFKVRLADLVMPKKGIKNWRSAFNKVNAKHIDFVITNSLTTSVIVLIELDDKSHNRKDRIERDQLVDDICLGVGYKLIHIPIANDYDFLELDKIFTGELTND